MAIDDVYQVSVRMQMTGQTYMNGLAFVRTLAAEPTIGEFVSLVNDIKEIHRPQQSTALSYTDWVARQVRGTGVVYPTDADCSPSGGNYFDGVPTGTLAGLHNGEILPHQCALVTTLRTGQIGRRKRGRFYAPGFTEAQQLAGTWDVALTSVADTNWAAFIAEYAIEAPVSGFRLGIWSVRTATGCAVDPATGTHLREDPPHPELAFTPVNQYVVRLPVFTQRRRRVGVGM